MKPTDAPIARTREVTCGTTTFVCSPDLTGDVLVSGVSDPDDACRVTRIRIPAADLKAFMSAQLGCNLAAAIAQADLLPVVESLAHRQVTSRAYDLAVELHDKVAQAMAVIRSAQADQAGACADPAAAMPALLRTLAAILDLDAPPEPTTRTRYAAAVAARAAAEAPAR